VTPATLDHLAEVLRDPVRRAALLRQIEALAAAERSGRPAAAPAAAPAPAPSPAPAPDPAAAAPPEAAAPAADGDALFTPTTLGGRLLVDLGEEIQRFSDIAIETVRSMADLPALWAGVVALWQDPAQQGRLLGALLYLLGLGAMGLALEGVAVGLLRRTSRRLDRMAPPDGNVFTWLRRVPLVVGRLGLDLVPIVLMGGAVVVALGFVRPAPAAQLVVLMAVHLYVAARAVLALARMLLSPASRHMRLLPASDAMAAWLIIWLRRMLVVGIGGYALAELAVLVGMPPAMHGALVRLGLLLVTLMLVRMIRQQRDRVAALLRPPPVDAEEGTDSTRRRRQALRGRLAESWHLLAVAWLLVGWAVAAVGVERGFARMLHGTVVTLALILAAKLLDEAMRWLLRRLLHPAPQLARRAPWLDRLARQYVPPFRIGWTVVLLAATLVLLSEAWGFRTLVWFRPGHPGHKLLGTALSIGFTALLGLLVWETANSAIETHLTNQLPEGKKAQGGMRLRTLLPVLRAFLATGVFAFIVFNVLQELGVNIGPLIAGAGVIGLAVGFGSQKLVQDVITGIFLLVEDSVAVGDVVSLGDRTGVVEHLTIRSIKLRALDGSIHWVPFSAVTTVTNMTRDFGYAVVDVTVGFQEDPDKVIKAMRAIAERMRAEPEWRERMTGEVEAAGMEKMTDAGMVFRVRARTAPGDRWLVARELNRRCRVELEVAGIDLPPPAPRLNVETPLNPMESASTGM
jgi:small-conductance mechanosensitive channel